MKGVRWYALAWLILIGGLWAVDIKQPALFVGALFFALLALAHALQKGPLIEQFRYEFTGRPPLQRCPLFFVTAAGALTAYALFWAALPNW